MKPLRVLLPVLLLLFSAQASAALYIVGSATAFNWKRAQMQEVSSNVFSWEGYLSQGGELKFMTLADGWGNHWGPAKPYDRLDYGVCNVRLHTNGDYKFIVDRAGWYHLEVDTKNRLLTAAMKDGSIPQARQWPERFYPIGTAADGYGTLQEVDKDAGIYSGMLTLNEGDLLFHSSSAVSDWGKRPVTAQLHKNATATIKKPWLTLSTDRCAYSPGETVSFSSTTVPPSGARVRYRHLADVVSDTILNSKTWTWTVPDEDYCGYMAEAYIPEEDHDAILATIAIDVSSDWHRFPRYGFVATFGSDKSLGTTLTEMKRLCRFHINAVQFQDWHCDHDQPLGGTREKPASAYKDIANRTIYLSAVRNYIQRQHEMGMQSIFYNLCFGVVDGYLDRGVKEEWLLFKDNKHKTKDRHDLPDSWKSDIYLADPANEEWQQYLADRNDDVYAVLDFDGYQIDQLGNRGTLYDYQGNTVSLTSGYASFIQAMKRRHPEKRLIMNAVSEYGTSAIAETGKVDALYNEVWGCHNYDALTNSEAQFSNLKSIIDKNRNTAHGLQTIFAAYMDYCCSNASFNTPGVVMTDAVIMALGGSHLELGGDHNLSREYFPSASVKTTTELDDWMTRYYDFMTAYENLLRGDWTENSSVNISSTAVTINKWAPKNGQVTQLTRTVEGRKVIHLLNFMCQESNRISDPAYLLCWHDRNGLRPWPVEQHNVPLTISGLGNIGKVQRIWVASPDYMGGAVQEITDYTLASGRLTLNLPDLQFWTMLVIEPESSVDDTVYGSAVDGQELVNSGSYALSAASSSYPFSLPANATFQASLSLPDLTLTLEREDADEVVTVPLLPATSAMWTLDGRPATPTEGGIQVGKGFKRVTLPSAN